MNHTAAGSGAENAMIRLLDCLPDEHARAVACPSDGPLVERLREHGIEQVDLPGTDLSLHLHPVQTARGLAGLVRSALSLRRSARRYRADVLHANSLRAGLVAGLARRLGGPPVVVQCHDDLPDNAVGRLIRRAIARGADEIVAVSDHTAAVFNRGLPRPRARRVYISVDHERFAPRPPSAAIREELSLPADAPLLAQIAQITPWKGQDTAIRALARVRARFDAHLLIVGNVAFPSRRYDNEGFQRTLERLVRELKLEDAVHFLGRREDVPALIHEVDLVLLPSWDEPFGLSAVEALAVGTPVLATDRGGVGEYVENGVNGRLVPPGDPEAWAAAICDLLADPAAIASMGEAGIRTAARFDDATYCSSMLETYSRAASA